MLQDEFKRQKTSEKENETQSGYVSFSGETKRVIDDKREEPTQEEATGDDSNPFGSDSGEEYDASGKNPFAE